MSRHYKTIDAANVFKWSASKFRDKMYENPTMNLDQRVGNIFLLRAQGIIAKC